VLEQAAFEDYPQAILDYINRGVTLQQLDQALYELGTGYPPTAAASADLTGDLKEDWVVSIFDPLSASTPPAGTLLIYTCNNGQFVLNRTLPSPAEQGAWGIRAIQELNNHAPAELVITSANCGASACFEELQVLAWDGSTLANRLVGTSLDLAFPELEMVDRDKDGVFSVELKSEGEGSAGAGPQRAIRRVWEYRPGSSEWQAGADVLGPAEYRIHMLHDADRLARSGKRQDALAAYARVAHDSTLLDYLDPVVEQANLGAYARFRMVVVYTELGQPSFAEIMLEEMDDLYPSGSPQRVYVDLTRAFLAGVVEAGLSQGCQAAQDFTQLRTEEILAPLGPAAFGTSNTEYKVEDICR
jgi:hypothetical protein